MKRFALGLSILISLISTLKSEKLYTVMSDANGVIKAPSVISGKLTNSSIVGSFFYDGTLSNVVLIGSMISNVNVGVGTISNATIYGGEAFDLMISNSVIKGSLITNSSFQGDGANITNINPNNVNGLKTMAFQNSNNVAITGGSISGVSISGDGSGLTNLFAGVGTTGLITIATPPGNKFLRDDGVFAAPESANATNVFWEDVQLKPDVVLNHTPVLIGGNNSNNFTVQVRTTANRIQGLEFYDGNNQKLFLRNSQPDLESKLWSSNSLVIDSANDIVIPPLAIGKNRLINGGFEFMERDEGGYVPLGDDVYGADRFYFLASNEDSFYYEKVGTPFNGAIFGGKLINDGASARFGMAQIVESINCQDLRGKAVTFSGWIKTSADATNQVAILEWKGTADSVTSDVVNNWSSHDYNINAFFINSADLLVGGVNELETTANTWTQFSVSANLTTEANNVIVFVFGEDNVPTLFNYQYANFQLEKGSVATSFEYRPSGLEFQLCQRYLQRFHASINNGNLAQGLVVSTSVAEILFPLTPMRATPSVNALSTGDWRIKDGSVTNSANNITLSSASNRGIVLNVSTAATLTLGRACYMLGLTANRPIYFSSEL